MNGHGIQIVGGCIDIVPLPIAITVDPPPITGTVAPSPANDFFNVVTQVVADAGIFASSINGISTAGIEIGMALKEAFIGVGNTIPVCGSGSTVTAIGVGQIAINPPCVNNILCRSCVISIGTTTRSNYVLDFIDDDNQSTIAFDDNENIETEADQILDFSEGNPFGTF